MKKILAISIFCLAAFSAGAQTMYDAINYADNNYYGTARSAALGNAVTAVGGDLGTIGINPAGAAVAGFSQFTLTPGLSISSTQSSYAPIAYGAVSGTTPESQTRFIMPNFGFIMNMDTGRKYGIKNFTFGMTLNTTNVFNERMSVGGTNNDTSMMGELAYFATGIPGSQIASGNSYYDTDYSWRDILAFQSGLISNYGEGDGDYIGSTEVIFDDGSIGLGGPIRQSFFRQRTGSKSDAVINLAFNVDDKLYFGGNVGIISLTFKESINRAESAVNQNDFALILDDMETAWLNGRERYSLETDGTGIYGKFGLIWLPVEGLRLGAAVKTPTLLNISERWLWDAVCNFEGFNSNLYETPVGDYTYQLVTPFNFNLGAAYTLGSQAMLSVDWERTDFRSMRFREADRSFGYGSFSEDNEYIRQNAGVTNNFRVGAEYKVTPAFALRAGYSYKNYAEKKANVQDLTHTASLGFGYSSPGSFFLDAAVRYTQCPDNWYYPYDDYLDVRSPEVCVSNNLMDVILTLGWRF
ncbi:MAG: outer membrane protein transport protein [Bacteroidales bacterium]|nr:outer membrane protein transport protein [Bacteroidales bacterium]